MMYFDYSATTKPLEEVMNSVLDVSYNYYANSNQIHTFGSKVRSLEMDASNQIKEVLGLNNVDVIYTSGATESNNMVISGVLNTYKTRGNKILTTIHEHPSISETLNHYKTKGFVIEYLKLDDKGRIDIEELKKSIDDNTILVAISSVTSELGITEPIDNVKRIVKDYPKCFLLVDHTQGIGKIDLELTDIDFISMSGHKIYGPKGIGLLIKRNNINIPKLIMGGASTTNFRSGTAPTPLIVGMSKAIRLSLDTKYEYVKSLNDYLLSNLDKNIIVNSTTASVPHIVNISLKNIKAEVLVNYLSNKEIYVSTKTACSNSNSYSDTIYKMYNNIERASHSIRVSLSKYTTKEEIDILIKELNKVSKEGIMCD